MASGWFIENIELEDPPNTDDRTINRTFQSETLFQFFPELTKSTARAFDYTMNGIVYPEAKAFALDQIARSADTNTIVIRIPSDQQIFNTTKFAVKSLKMARTKPLFVWFVDRAVQAVPYSITFTELADDGESTEGADGFQEANEGGLGLQFLEQLTEQFTAAIGGIFGPFEVFQSPDLGASSPVIAIPVEAAI